MSLLSDSEAQKFIDFVVKVKSVDLNGYRKSFVARRLSARLLAHKLSSLDDYISLLEENPEEWEKFFENLCINVSEFFRDPDVFNKFRSQCIPELIKQAEASGRNVINVWSCGCSCGEESYSLAILFLEFLRANGLIKFSVKVIATDIDVDALMKARQGIYFEDSLSNVSEDLRKRYFVFVPSGVGHIETDGWQVNEDVRKIVSFEKHNLITDGFLPQMDVIFMRNVRIYFDKARAKDILISVYDALRVNGILVLGKIESVGVSLRHMFTNIDAVNRIYRRN